MTLIGNEVRASVDGAAIARSLVAPEAFTAVFDRHYVAVHRYLARRIGRDQADDLASQTFMLAFAHRGRYRDELGTARPWLLGIATNLLRADRRAEQRRLAMLQALGSQASDAPSSTNGHQDLAFDPAVAAALAALDSRQRDALLLHVWGELSYTEVATALRLPIGTVRSRISRACSALRGTLERTSHA
jgi:RNA polymerase sigma-70 factor (ECF subfamily)